MNNSCASLQLSKDPMCVAFQICFGVINNLLRLFTRPQLLGIVFAAKVAKSHRVVLPYVLQ